MFLPKVIGYQIEIPALGIEYLPSSGWSGVMWRHQTIQTIAIALSCPPELDADLDAEDIKHTLQSQDMEKSSCY